MARFDTMTASLVTAARDTNIAGRTEAIRALHESARAAELAWPGSKAKVPPPNGNQGLTLRQLNALAIGPNT